MKVLLELDTSAGDAGMRAALDVISRLYGGNPLAAVTTPVPTGPTPAPAPAPQPAAPPSAPSAPPPTTAPAAPPPNVPHIPAPAPAAPAAAPAPTPVSPGGITQAQFSQQVNAFAEKYGAKPTKQRFAEMATAFQQPGWTSTNSVPADRYDDVIKWFAVA